jgi:LasA protease
LAVANPAAAGPLPGSAPAIASAPAETGSDPAPGEAEATASDPALETAVLTAMTSLTGLSRAAAQADGRTYRVAPQRYDEGWAFGFGVLRAALRADDHPRAWLFLARHNGAQWTAALEDSQTFYAFAAQAPMTVFGKAEKGVFRARELNSTAAAAPAIGGPNDANNNTGLQMPWQIGQSWTLTQGPHGWIGPESPYTAIDVVGGDNRVLAAGDGAVFTVCSDTNAKGRVDGWRRIYHPGRYSTDYYHMKALPAMADGTVVSRGTFIGKTGKNLCDGGSTSGTHLHFALLSDGALVSLHRKMIGQWVFWATSPAGSGYALHGSTRVNIGGSLYSYPPLAFDHAIIDTNGAGTINRYVTPGAGNPVVGILIDGQEVLITCHRASVESHTGRYGSTSVWNRLPDGSWFSDAYAYTGRRKVGPAC